MCIISVKLAMIPARVVYKYNLFKFEIQIENATEST